MEQVRSDSVLQVDPQPEREEPPIIEGLTGVNQGIDRGIGQSGPVPCAVLPVEEIEPAHVLARWDGCGPFGERTARYRIPAETGSLREPSPIDCRGLASIAPVEAAQNLGDGADDETSRKPAPG